MTTPTTAEGRSEALLSLVNADGSWTPEGMAVLRDDLAEIIEAARAEAAAEIAALRGALMDLSRFHEGYSQGMGPCVCPPHLAAYRVLADTAPKETN